MDMQRAAVVSLSGSLDVYCVTEVAAALAEASESREAVIDLGDVRYMDATALSLFVRLRNQRTASGHRPPVFVGLTPKVQRLFNVVGL